jgi:hypothetical protein
VAALAAGPVTNQGMQKQRLHLLELDHHSAERIQIKKRMNGVEFDPLQKNTIILFAKTRVTRLGEISGKWVIVHFE